MCTYCMMADWANRYVPDQPAPWTPWSPAHPFPTPWTRQQLEEFEELLRQVKAMEDKLGGCPCEEPKKLDFLKDIRTRLDRQADQIDAERPDEPDAYTDDPTR